jgi:CAAX protease family protein
VSESTPSVVASRPAGRITSASHDLRSRPALFWLLALFLVTLAVSLVKGQDVFVFAYIMIVIFAVGGPRRFGRSWVELGIKPGFVADLRSVWYLAGLDAIVFQFVPPTVLVAFMFGYGPQLVDHISGRLPIDISSAAGLSSLSTLLVVALVLTLVEELVFRVTIQQRLSLVIGTPAAILATALLFGLTHAVGTTGNPQVILSDIAGVALDGALFGLIYARTHNLLLTWTTHYAADVVGIVALLTVFAAA